MTEEVIRANKMLQAITGGALATEEGIQLVGNAAQLDKISGSCDVDG